MKRRMSLLVVLLIVGAISCEKETTRVVPQDAVSRISYTINMLCISKSLESGQDFVCPEKYFVPLVKSAKLWAKANPQTQIQIWYDPSTTSKQAVSRSQDLLKEGDPLPKNARLAMRSISDIPIVSQNKDIFSSKLPLYFRIDLLKLVILTHEIADRKLQSSIFADVEVGNLRDKQDRMSYDELFEPQILEQLKKVGLLNNASVGQENQFLQVWGDEAVVAALKLWVNVNLARGAFALNLTGPMRDGFFEKFYVSAFYTTIRFFPMYYQASRYGKVEINLGKVSGADADEWVPYDQKKHGVTPFGDAWSVIDEIGWMTFGSKDPSSWKPVTSGVVRYLDKGGEPWKVMKHERKVDVRGGSSHTDEVPARDPQDTKTYGFTPWE